MFESKEEEQKVLNKKHNDRKKVIEKQKKDSFDKYIDNCHQEAIEMNKKYDAQKKNKLIYYKTYDEAKNVLLESGMDDLFIDILISKREEGWIIL